MHDNWHAMTALDLYMPVPYIHTIGASVPARLTRCQKQPDLFTCTKYACTCLAGQRSGACHDLMQYIAASIKLRIPRVVTIPRNGTPGSVKYLFYGTVPKHALDSYPP